MFCISNAIVWVEDRGGGSAHRVTEGHEQKTISSVSRNHNFLPWDFLDAVKGFGTSCCCKEDGVLGHRFSPEFIYFF